MYIRQRLSVSNIILSINDNNDDDNNNDDNNR